MSPKYVPKFITKFGDTSDSVRISYPNLTIKTLGVFLKRASDKDNRE